MSETSETLEKQAAELNRCFEKLMIHIGQMQQSLSGENDFCEINKQEANVVFTLGERGASIMRELAKNLRLHVSTMTGIVDKLIEKGLVARERSNEDRRIVQVSLTEAGKITYNQEYQKRQQLNLIILNSLDEAERQIFIKLFGKIASNLEKNS